MWTELTFRSPVREELIVSAIVAMVTVHYENHTPHVTLRREDAEGPPDGRTAHLEALRRLRGSG